ncbi:hypothetical protein Nepgr_001611 [Nepenthes gracilis]|uniref:Pentatricopeptide repeat-containing protein n=1 Tax=Nepenthes gracilis TaxID=150966 RepID=A0AAD3P5G8_NEPGR|nr:hypothetical protein Nepgr_001611 [Nepenthes gracilis]
MWLEVERRILRQLHSHKTRTRLLEIHAHFLRHGLHQSNQILSHFVSVCRAENQMTYAALVFQQSLYPNIILFNSMIKGYSLCGPFEKALHLFTRMRNRGIWPDEYTFGPLIKACCNLCDLSAGQCIHGEILKLGFESHSSVGIGIVELYANCERTDDAKKLFDEIPQRDVVSWNLLINGFCKSGDVDRGLHLFREMSERSIASWNTLISFFSKNGRDDEALELFRKMQVDGFKPDETTVVSILPACARLGAVDVGKWIHSHAQSSELFRDSITGGNSILNFYCKCGEIEAALMIFREMPLKNVISWNTMISGLAFNGKGELGLDLFEEMMSVGVNPDDSSFVAVLTCCAHARLLQKGRNLFASMTARHQLHPKLEHYGCMADLLGRIGCVREAYDLIKSMPMRPNASLWGSLLSASRMHGDTDLAECAIKELINLEPWNSGNYVLLSNIYAEGRRWDEVEGMRVLMKENNIKKTAGHSMVG